MTLNSYIKLFTTTPPTVIKVYATHPFESFALILVVAAILLAIMVLCFYEDMRNAKGIVNKVIDLIAQALGGGLIILSLLTSIFFVFERDNPIHKRVIASGAPKIERRAIQSAHKEYPYVLEIASSNANSNTHYLLKHKPHKGMVDLYKLKFGQNKPYIKHVSYRALTIKENFSIYNSVSYFHNKVKENANAWNEPGTSAEFSGMSPN